jgi:UDP-N-acetylmuramoyl-tripeptide--D-alanyl-D-alanine ligase
VRTLEAAKIIKAETVNLRDLMVTGFSIDTRTISEGDLFFAFSPEDYKRHSFTGSQFTDGHAFIPTAFEKRAVAAVARKESVAANSSLAAFGDRLLLVDDVIEALQKIANNVITAWGRPVVAITGSAGKTTTKDLTAHLLEHSGKRVLKSQKNFNNEIGVPLSILNMVSGGKSPSEFEIAVLEMGMSTAGELTKISGIAPPDIVVELCVAPVHLEFFGTIEKIADAKMELVQGIKPGGTVVLNADDKLVSNMRRVHTGPVLTFGIENRADVMAQNISTEQLGVTRFTLITPQGKAQAELPMPGRHNLMNALAAAAVATTQGITPDRISEALQTAAPSNMRGEILKFREGFMVIDDSYNSNPKALLSMVNTLAADSSIAKRRIVIAGEMLELGGDAPQLHKETGMEIARCGIDILWGVRGFAQNLVDGAIGAGMRRENTEVFERSEEAAEKLVNIVQAGDLILVKGSRGVQTDRVVERLKEKFSLVQEACQPQGAKPTQK